jgi:hypothetical protein
MRNTTPRTPSLPSIDPALLMMVSGGRKRGCKFVINNNYAAQPPQPPAGQPPSPLPTALPNTSLSPSDPSASGGVPGGAPGGDQVSVSVSINGQPVAS